MSQVEGPPSEAEVLSEAWETFVRTSSLDAAVGYALPLLGVPQLGVVYLLCSYFARRIKRNTAAWLKERGADPLPEGGV